jgi:hypothetical protein
MNDNEIILDINWCSYPPKSRIDDFSSIPINAENVLWENIPYLKT